MTPDMQKNSKNEKFIQIFFGSKQPKKLENTSSTPFVKFPMNFRPLTLKKELSDFSKIPWPRICKKTQKMRNLYKIFFGSKQPKKLWNTSATPFLKFPMNFKLVTLKKELSDLSKNAWPRVCKKLKKWEIYTKFIFGSKQPKKLWNTSATPFLKFLMNFKLVTLKKELSDLSKECMTPGMQKTQTMRNLYKIFFG